MAAGKRVEMHRYPPSDHRCNYSYFSDLADADVTSPCGSRRLGPESLRCAQDSRFAGSYGSKRPDRCQKLFSWTDAVKLAKQALVNPPYLDFELTKGSR